MSNPELALEQSLSTTNASYFIIVYVLVLIYCCFALAIVCDVYFVPALQKLSCTYDLPPDIAGSTLMALGASVPELFASLIGVFITEDDIGTGSIIGSSCFNLIAVPAACAFVAAATFPKKLVVSPGPVMRNSAFYAITILVLLLIIKDQKVDIPEAAILLLFFVMYMGYMIFCAQSKSCPDCAKHHRQSSSLTSSYTSVDSAIAGCGANNQHHYKPQAASILAAVPSGQRQFYENQLYFADSPDLIEVASGQPPVQGNFLKNNLANEKTPLCGPKSKSYDFVWELSGASQQPDQKQPQQLHCEPIDSVSIQLGIAIKNSTCLRRKDDELEDQKCNKQDDANNHEHSWLNSKWILVPMIPVTLLLKVLTPLKFRNTCWTIWTFIVSIALIGALTYVSVSMVHLFGQALNIPETVAGMTILSWGTGIPELIASIVLIKKTAQADMAICNTIGSNVIDASFCLSVPWIVKCAMNKAQGLAPEVEVQSAALPWSSFTLLITVVILLLVLKLHNWELSCSVGVWLLLTYIAFAFVATYLESSFCLTGLDLLALI